MSQPDRRRIKQICRAVATASGVLLEKESKLLYIFFAFFCLLIPFSLDIHPTVSVSQSVSRFPGCNEHGQGPCNGGERRFCPS